VHNGPPHAGFGLVRGWIENYTAIEIGGREMREQYERFFREIVAHEVAGAPLQKGGES
jgi:predicted SprT family Zn-dependent metalloprotease